MFRTAYRMGCHIAREQSLFTRERSLPIRDLNHLAWLCGSCGSELEKGRRHTEGVVKVAPYKATYHDTPAQVLAAQGKLDEATATQRRPVALDPWSSRHDYRVSLRELIEPKARQGQTEGR